jgi:hypothetical protein
MSKKTRKVILIIVGVVVLLLGGMTGLLHTKIVQTYIINQVTKQVAENWQVDMHVSKFHYKPLSRLTIDSIYLSDQQKDTLAYIEQLEFKFNPLELRHMHLDIDLLKLRNPYINIKTTADSTLNCQFLLDVFKKDSANFPLHVSVDELILEQTRLRYNEFLVDQLDLALTLPMWSQDSLDVYIDAMHLRAQVDRLDATFEANLHGGLDSIFADNMQLEFRGEQLFDGTIAIYHPTNLDSLYIQANCNQLYCNNILLQDLLSQLRMQPVKLPKPVENLEHIHYVGDITGRLEHMKLHGAFKTPLGTLRVNGTMQADSTLKYIDFTGNVSTKQFQLGSLLENKDLGCVALDAHVDGSIDSVQFTNCKAKAHIQKIEYRGYTYKNININGEWNIDEVNGCMSINDENIQLTLNGLADWDQNDTRIDVTMQVNNFKPAALHLTNKNPDLQLDAITYVSLYTSGTKEELLDNLNGYIIIDTLKLSNKQHATTIDQIKVLIDSKFENNLPTRQIRVQSDLVTANLSGAFRYRTLPATIQHLMYAYMPVLVEQPKQKYPHYTKLDFYAYFRQLDQLTKVLELGVNVPSYPTLKGYIHDQQINVQAFIPEVKTKKNIFENITFSMNNINRKSMDFSLYMLTHLPQDNPTAAKLGDIKTTFTASAAKNNVDLNVLLGNTDSIRNEGNISISTHVSNYLKQPKFDIKVKPTHIILNDSAWSISPTTITYTQATNSIDVRNFKINTNYQSIQANGKASKAKSDSINIQLNNINLDYLLGYTNVNEVISIMGPVSGTATIYSALSEPMVEAQASIKNGGLNGVYLGDVNAEAHLDRPNKRIMIKGDIVDSTHHRVADIHGKVIPADSLWSLDIDCDSLDVSFIDFWTDGIISDPTGLGYGHLYLEGKKKDFLLVGKALIKNGSLTVPQTGVRYSFTDSIYLDSTAIRFPNVELYDQFNNKGVFFGNVYHKSFNNWSYDLGARANKLLVMDIPRDQQAFFYGDVFATGDIHIYGADEYCNIDVTAKSEANTNFYLNVYSASQASQSNFIHFTKPDTTSYGLLTLLQPKQSEPVETNPTKVRLTILGEATPQAEMNILLGGEDAIIGRGEGNLKFTYEYPSENIQLQGNYILQSGIYNFSLGNIVRRNFTIREGSKITWDSDPMSPTLDLTGHYHTTASLRDLFGSESAQIATNRTSVPVNCVLHLSDQLFNPILNFAIELPQSDESVQSQVSSLINTEEMLMRQIIYLLVFNRFYTPEYLQNTQNVGLNETYSLLSSTVTGQINSWLSKLTDIFTMGFNFRTDGEGETASQEYEANFQIHPINQLVINGNFGYRYNDLSNRPFFGDLDVEYLLTENGKLRVKAYTHTVDKYSLRQANTVQGIGLVFKHDFNWKKSTRKNKATESSANTTKKRNKNNSHKTIKK